MEQELLCDHDIFVVHDLLSAAACAAYIEETEHEEYTDAPVTTAQGPVWMPSVRNNRRVMLDREDWAEALWASVRTLSLPWEAGFEPCGLNERLRFYRYDPGQLFALHADGAYVRPGGGERSFYTVMVYLSEGCEGGDTVFPDLDVAVSPQRGMGLFFRHDLVHEGEVVTAGRKYVLRTDLMYRAER